MASVAVAYFVYPYFVSPGVFCMILKLLDKYNLYCIRDSYKS